MFKVLTPVTLSGVAFFTFYKGERKTGLPA